VDGAIIDDEGWRVVALRVRLRKDAADRIGVKRGVLHPAMLAVSTDVVQGVRDAVILRARTAELRAPPEPAAERKPVTDEQEARPPSTPPAIEPPAQHTP
jgi:hypothetical protein